ncbi:MAG: DUF933 domain-containing protein [Candidatus Omnitrophica bacterium]|nr:DUF933 domain-containing protein [Candidatus Omnitrophota bacterium]
MKIAVWGLNFVLGKKNLEDRRIKELELLLHPKRVSPIQIELLDFSHLRDADAIILKENLKEDLLLMDLERIEELVLKNQTQRAFFTELKEILEKEIFLNEVNFSSQDYEIIQVSHLLTIKPTVLMKEEEIELLKDKIKELYYKAKRICFFTANENELRAWEIKQGTNAYQASGLIHSDIQKGFIRAEVIGYDSIIQAGGVPEAKAKGLMRLENKEYIIQDGDLIYFRFNV